MNKIATCILLSAASLLSNSGYAVDSKKDVADVIPITAANLRGHAALYREGWFVVSSSERALKYAKVHAIRSSGQAVTESLVDIKSNSKKYGADVVAAIDDAIATSRKVYQSRLPVFSATHSLAKEEMDYGSDAMSRAWSRFIKGNLSLVQRTQADREALKRIPGDYFTGINDDFSNIYELTHKASEVYSSHIQGRWAAAFDEAKSDFQHAYEKSGTRSNSLSAVGDMLVGYVSVVYSGLVKPMTRSGVQGAEATAKLAGKLIFLPVAGLYIVTEKTVSSVGLTFIYAGDMGVKLVSPTVESGLLAGMSLLAYSSVPATYAVGGAAGVVNQVAVTAAAPLVGVAQGTAQTAAETVQYAAQVSYDIASGATQVTIHQSLAGVALGYNALTAIPVQTLLGAANGVVFLAWDGPRLVLATAKGEVRWRDEKGTQYSEPVKALPVGSVVDLRALKNEQGIEVDIVNDDPAVIEKVLEKLPDDLRTGEKHD